MNKAVAAAWKEAGKKLGLTVETAVTVELAPGRSEVYEALVHDFGKPAGTLITTTDRMDLLGAVDATPYYGSALNPLHYSVFEREVFVEALRDWGWTGEGSPPEWL